MPRRGLLSALFHIAFKSRLCLPLLISAGFMLLDLHLRLDVEIEANVVEQEVDNTTTTTLTTLAETRRTPKKSKRSSTRLPHSWDSKLVSMLIVTF